MWTSQGNAVHAVKPPLSGDSDCLEPKSSFCSPNHSSSRLLYSCCPVLTPCRHPGAPPLWSCTPGHYHVGPFPMYPRCAPQVLLPQPPGCPPLPSPRPAHQSPGSLTSRLRHRCLPPRCHVTPLLSHLQSDQCCGYLLGY